MQHVATNLFEEDNVQPWLHCVVLRRVENIIDTLAFNIQCLRPVLKHIADRHCITVVGSFLDCIDGNKRYASNDISENSAKHIGFNSKHDIQNMIPFVEDVIFAINHCVSRVTTMASCDTLEKLTDAERIIRIQIKDVFTQGIGRETDWLNLAQTHQQRLHSVAEFGLINTGTVWDEQVQRQACFQWKSDVMDYLQQTYVDLSREKLSQLKTPDVGEHIDQREVAGDSIRAVEFYFNNCCKRILHSCNFCLIPNSEELQAKLRSFCILPDIPATNPQVFHDTSVLIDTLDTSQALIQRHKPSDNHEDNTGLQSRVLRVINHKLDNILDLFLICKRLFSCGPDRYRKPMSY